MLATANLDSSEGKSTPELFRAEKARVVGRIRDLPGVNDQRDQTHKISTGRDGVQSCHLPCGCLTLLDRPPIFQLVNSFDLRLKKESAQENQNEHQNDERKLKATEWFARVNHLGEKMSERDDGTNKIYREITANDVLCDHAGVVVAKNAFHLFAENCGRDTKREEKGGAEPDGSIKRPDDAQDREHMERLVHSP